MKAKNLKVIKEIDNQIGSDCQPIDVGKGRFIVSGKFPYIMITDA